MDSVASSTSSSHIKVGNLYHMENFVRKYATYKTAREQAARLLEMTRERDEARDLLLRVCE